MNKDEAVYYVGLMVGLICGTLLLRAMGVGGIWQLVGGLVVGVGFGYVAERLYKGSKAPPQQPPGIPLDPYSQQQPPPQQQPPQPPFDPAAPQQGPYGQQGQYGKPAAGPYAPPGEGPGVANQCPRCGSQRVGRYCANCGMET